MIKHYLFNIKGVLRRWIRGPLGSPPRPSKASLPTPVLSITPSHSATSASILRHRRSFDQWLLEILPLLFLLGTPVGITVNWSPSRFDLRVTLLNTAHAVETNAIPEGWESYLSRPDILAVEARMSDNLGTTWSRLKAAHFSAIAELLEIYPEDTHFYFLGRDSEYLYDVARLVTEGSPVDQSRMHLLNVSRANMDNSHLKDYLSAHGISEESLLEQKPIVLVDTGFSGTISRIIRRNFSGVASARLKTHLLVSSNIEHPSSRFFLRHLNPTINEISPASMHGSIVSYEHIPRYTDRSSTYKIIDGYPHPLSPIDKQTDGSVSKVLALAQIQDLKAEWEKPEIRITFSDERALVRKIKELMTADKKEDAIIQLKELLHAKDPAELKSNAETIVRDLIDSQKNVNRPLTVSLSDLNLKEVSVADGDISKKNELIKKYPEWAQYLEDPETGIKNLFAKHDWQMIGNFIDANIDNEINRIIERHLYANVATGPQKKLQILMIEKGNLGVLQNLAANTFSKPHTAPMTDLIKLLIEKADQSTLRRLAMDTFSRPHTAEMINLLKLIIEKADQDTLKYLVRYTFSRSHTAPMADLLKLVIEKADQSTLQILAVHTFLQPHIAPMTDLLKLLIEKVYDRVTLDFISSYVFLQRHAQTPVHLILKQSLAIADLESRKNYLEKELAQLEQAKNSSPNSSPSPQQCQKALSQSSAGIF